MRTKHVFANKEEEKTWQMHLICRQVNCIRNIIHCCTFQVDADMTEKKRHG
jgi:hypothetical protein